MILIADCGSTKTEWREVNDGIAGKSYISSGINPFFVTLEEIVGLLGRELPGLRGKPYFLLWHWRQQCSQGGDSQESPF